MSDNGSGAPGRLNDPDYFSKTLGYKFKNKKLLLEALTHRSYVNESDDPEVVDNERLEFLGDAVIDLIVSVELMAKNPDAREGPLSKMRAAIVSESALAEVAESLNLGGALRLGRGEQLSGGRSKPSLLSDAFEALMAAIYLDAGLDTVKDILLKYLEFPTAGARQTIDAKTELQQRVQATRHITPSYRVVKESGPDHDKTFVVEISVGSDVLGRGQGKTKKEAEQKAAAKALKDLEGPE